MMRVRQFLQPDEVWVADFAKSVTGFTACDQYQVTATEWANSILYRLTFGDRSLIVKTWRQGSVSELRQWRQDSNALATRLGRFGDGPVLPEVYAVHDHRAAVAMEFLDGTPGGPWLAAHLREPSSTNLTSVVDVASRWGRALAGFHRCSLTDSRETARKEAERQVGRVRRRLRLPEGATEKLLPSIIPCRSHNDVGFHNILILEDGVLGFLDYFEANVTTTIHQDVAAALAWLEDAYRDSPWRSRGHIRPKVSLAFLEGYSEASGVALDRSGDRGLLALFLASAHLQWCRTALRRRHPGHALASLGRALAAGLRLTTRRNG